MALDRYRRKRDFSRTPEPAGGDDVQALPTGGRGGRFVVGRHRARRLHYDLRLEIGGVLASWAVPKGPSLDPAARRAAIRVEDHPLAYLAFEGPIPRGEYGGGDAIVWDWGTFEPEAATPDPLRALAEGELKFRLEGQKLRGRFTLVRTGAGGAGGGAHGGAGREAWLLIHKRDAFAAPGWDAEDQPRSVKTGRTNEEVAAGVPPRFEAPEPAAPRPPDLSAAVAAPFPGFIEPMAATLAADAFDDPAWLFEVKWDGYRVETAVRAGTVRLFTRSGNDAATYFPDLLTPQTWLDAREAVVDGEVVALDEAGRPDFGRLQERLGVSFEGGGLRRRPAVAATGPPGARVPAGRRGRGVPAGASPAPLVYQVFDLLYLEGRSLLRVPLEERKRRLRQILRDHPRVSYAAHVEGAGRAFLAAARERGLEGIVAKHRRSRYEPGRRASTWLKIKLRPEQEFVVGGFASGQGTARELGALLVGTYEGRRLAYAGRIGNGFDDATRRQLRARLEATARSTCPFEPPPPAADGRGAIWVEPWLVVRAAFASWTREGLIRQPSYKGLEPEKAPGTVGRERAVPAAEAERSAEAAVGGLPTVGPAPSTAPGRTRGRPTPPDDPSRAATPDELATLEGLGAAGRWSLGGIELRLTNLDRVLFPPQPGHPDQRPITKRELIAYCVRIGPAMLPHLADRPLNIHRFPDGITSPGFWQRAIPATAPAWLRTWTETGVGGRTANRHLVADRTATLAWLGNQAGFEIHPWTARLTAPERPTFALVDIDPGTRTTWEETLVLARLFRTALAHLGVTGFAKTTGRRGLQVWIPIVPRYSFEATSAWVEQLSRAVAAAVPELVSWAWSVGERQGRARLDYTQNAPIKTLVAPYAVRPAAGAPVSTPVAWHELDDPRLRPDRWTIRDILARVEALGDLFAAAQTLTQELPPLS